MLENEIICHSRSPERVASCILTVEGRECMDLQDSVIRGHRLEGNVSVPVRTVKLLDQQRNLRINFDERRHSRRKLTPVRRWDDILAVPLR